MFSDIEDLTKEIEEFKFNMQETSQLCKTLQNVGANINKSKENLENKYNSFTEDLSRYSINLESSGKKVLEDNIKIIDKQKEYIEQKVELIINDINNQQLLFQDTVEMIMGKLGSIQLESLLKASDKINRKINIVYLTLGVITIMNIIILVLK